LPLAQFLLATPRQSKNKGWAMRLGRAVTGAAAFAACFLASTANASLLGKQMTAGSYFPEIGTLSAFLEFTPGNANPSSTFTVGNGAEATANQVSDIVQLVMDFTATSLEISMVWNNPGAPWSAIGPFNGLFFKATEGLGIASFTVDAATTLPSFDASYVEITDDEIRINFAGLVAPPTSVVKINFAFADVAVPEPSLLPLFAMMAGGLLLARRRRES
jgi:hypothetical protein